MYYVFSSKISGFRNTIMQAILNTDFSWNQFWWDSMPTNEDIPILEFTVSYDDKYPDNFFTGSEFEIYSDKLISIFKESGISFEVFPTTIRNKKGEKINLEYFNFRILVSEDAIDYNKSIISKNKIRKLVLKKPYYEKPILMFRLKDRLNLVIVHEIIKQKIEENGITGCSFVPIGDFQLGVF